MKMLFVTLLLLITLGISGVNPLSETARGQRPNKYRAARPAKRIRDQYIVLLNERADPDREASRLARAHSGDLSHGHIYHDALKGFSLKITEANARRLATDPQVKFVEEDSLFSVATVQRNPPWGLDRIDQRDPPEDNRYNYLSTGKGVRAYIIDSGIRATHREFGGRVISGFTAINDNLGTDDCRGHGTQVAGIVGGSTYGVAKDVTLVAVRVFPCVGDGSDSGIIAAVDYVTRNHVAGQPAVANMSMSGGESDALDEAVNHSIADGITYTVAAGNDNDDACTKSPARLDSAITVGATRQHDERTSLSNFGRCVDLFAPGENIKTSGNQSDNDEATAFGTSMAAPHVAGVVALLLEGTPGTSPHTIAAEIINGATTDHLRNIGPGSPNRLLYSYGKHLWQLQQINTGGQTTGPAAVGDATATVFGSQFHVLYRDSVGAIQDAFFGSSGRWQLQKINLSGLTPGPAAVGDATAIVFGSQFHVLYRDSAGAIQDAFFGSSGRWQLQKINLSGLTPGPAAVGDPIATVFGRSQRQFHVLYRDRDGAIQDAFFDSSGRWQLQKINMGGRTTGPAAIGDPTANVFGSQFHAIYRDSAGLIQDAYFDGTWSVDQLNLAGGPPVGPAAAGDALASVFNRQSHVTYRASGGQIWDFFF